MKGMRVLTYMLISTGAFIFFGCLEEQTKINPNVEGVSVQLHNFNSQIGARPYIGTDPDILYFKQQEDGSYIFSLTGKSWWPSGFFETDWNNEYVVVKMDSKGVVSTVTTENFPMVDGAVANIAVTSFGVHPWEGLEIPRNHIVTNKELIYSQFNPDNAFNNVISLNMSNGNQQKLFRNFENANSKYFDPRGLFKTRDGYTTINYEYSDDKLLYSFYSSSGQILFSKEIPAIDGTYFSHFIVDSNGEYYFLNLDPLNMVGFTYSFEFNQTNFLDLLYGPFQYASRGLGVDGDISFSVEIRFGPGKSQKAHRFLVPPGASAGVPASDYTYQDYVDVPFEVWDITNNRQLMVSFRDQGRDGEFNLINYDLNSSAELQSREYLNIHDVVYSDTPNPGITVNGGYVVNRAYYFWPVLLDGEVWDPSSLPNSYMRINSIGIRFPQGVIKINESGITVVNQNLSTPVPIENIYSVVTYNGGYAVLCNVHRTFYMSDQNPVLIILDANFNQVDAFEISSRADAEKLESNGDAILYSNFIQLPGEDRIRISLTTLNKGKKITRYLDDFIQFQLEGYKTTATKNGGWALLAWVMPTPFTRELIFLELDENLELVKK